MFHSHKKHFSQMLCTFVYIPVSEHFSFYQDNPYLLTGVTYQEADLNSMVITQVHLVLGTNKKPF